MKGEDAHWEKVREQFEADEERMGREEPERCEHCGELLFEGNPRCLNCGAIVGFC